MNRKFILSSALVWGWMAWPLEAGEPSNAPKPVPATRPELKTALEALKERHARIPQQTPSDAAAKVSSGRSPDDLLPTSWGRGGGVENGPGRRATFKDVFTDPLFWVVSRANNCQYCLGHQELKLRIAGVDDDTIAALDFDWSRFDARQQAALAFARKLTLEPQLVGNADIAELKKSFADGEITELAFVIARFNAVNRWTDGVGLPQEHHFRDDQELLLTTPTNAAFEHTTSIVTPNTRASRTPPAIAEAIKAIVECRHRTSRVSLPSDEAAKAALKDAIGDREPRNWERAMAQLKDTGPAQVATLNTIMTDDNLNPRLKTELFLITAANNRAWYAVAHAACRLHGMGASYEDMAALISESPPGDAAAAYRLAAKSAVNPHLITDADIAAVREHFSDKETAEIVQVICMANMFDRFTESLGLPLEDDICS